MKERKNAASRSTENLAKKKTKINNYAKAITRPSVQSIFLHTWFSTTLHANL